MEQESLLSDIEFNPTLASTGQRFLNYIIDIVCYYLFIFFISILIVMAAGADAAISLQGVGATYAFVFGTFLIYFFLSELIFKGRTIGKFITRTKVLNEDGTMPTAKTYLLRTLCRFVPFEPFSAFGSPPRPWHDKWTKTMVIDVKKTALQNPS